MSETWNNDQIAAFIARDIPDGAYVNLGIGRPEAVANHIPADKEIILQSENGLLGMGGAASTTSAIWNSSMPAKSRSRCCPAARSSTTRIRLP